MSYPNKKTKTAKEVETYMNIDLQTVSQWLQSNLFTLNSDKSRFVLFGTLFLLRSVTALLNMPIHSNTWV